MFFEMDLIEEFGPRTRRKKRGPDILEQKVYPITSADRCHGTTEMLTTIPAWSRAYVCVTVLVFGLLFGSVSPCDVDSCFNKYLALKSLGKSQYNVAGSDSYDICTGLRTYKECMDNLSRCKGVIKYHSDIEGTRKEMEQNQCSPTGPTYTFTELPPVLPPDELCAFQGEKVHKHCVLFGDPHLRTFDGRYQTCKVEGAWPLINNKHLTIQVTNEPVANSIGATATTKLTVIIKKNIECAHNKYVTYQTESNMLSSTFENGKTAYGRSRNVELIEVEAGKHVEIKVRYIDTKIVIRQVGSYLTVVVSMPEEVVKSAKDNELELCVGGCPKQEIIDYKEVLSKREGEVSGVKVLMLREEAVELCRKAKVVDFYLDSCVFDLMMTGNKSFTASAFQALQDVLSTDPDYIKTQPNRDDLKPYDGGVSSLSASSISIFKLLILTALIYHFTKRASGT